MTSHGDRLYVIQDDTLWRVDPTNGSFKKVHTVTSDPIEPQAARLVSIESTRLAATTGANASSASVGDSNGTTSTVTWVNPIIAPAPVRTTEQTQAGTASANQVTGSAAVSNITRTAESLGSERRMKETLHRAALDAVLANVDGLLYTGPFKDAIDVLSRSAGPGNGRIHG